MSNAETKGFSHLFPASMIVIQYELIIEYANGERKKYNMLPQLKNNSYKKLNDINYFVLAKNAEVTVEWPEGEDVDPNELYENSVICS